MTNELTVFKNADFSVRTITDENDEIWFVAKDVAEALGYQVDGGMTKYFKHVPDIWKGGKRISTLGGNQELLCLSEQGLYFFLGRSDKPKALPYQMWIAGEVMPDIRKHGMYLTPKAQELLKTDPKVFDSLVDNYVKQKDINRRLEKELAEAQTFATLGRCVLALPGSITVQDAAHLLAQKGIPIGQNRLYAECRKKGLLCKRKGKQWNKPTQKAIDEHLFNSQIGNGFYTVTMVTPQGLSYLIKTLSAEHYPLIVLMEAQDQKQIENGR